MRSGQSAKACFRRSAIVLSALLFWTIKARSQEVLDLNATVAASCPSDQDPESLSAWRLGLAADLQAGRISDAGLQSRLKACFPSGLPACYQRLNDYSLRNDLARAALDVSAAQSPQKTLPREFYTDDGESLLVPTDIEALAAARSWMSVRYKSRHSGGFDAETASLLMIYVPGDRVTPPVSYDRWINIALPVDAASDAMNPLPQKPVPGPSDYASELQGGAQLPRTLTMVTLDRGDEQSSRSTVYFQKFHRDSRGSGVFSPEANATPSGCYSCHPNGLRAISPLGYHVRAGETQMTGEQWAATRAINAAMEKAARNQIIDWRDAPTSAGAATRKPLLRPTAQGPLIGPLKPLNSVSRSEAFIMGGLGEDGTRYAGCFKSRTQVDVRDIFNRAPGRNNVYRLTAAPSIDWKKVTRAMRCESCHNNQGRGALNAATAQAQIDFKILVDQSMPFGWHKNPGDQNAEDAAVIDLLSPDERIALANCLEEEAKLERQLLAKWLSEPTCN